MKQGNLFCLILFVMLRSPKPHSSCCALGIFEKLSISKGALTWLENV